MKPFENSGFQSKSFCPRDGKAVDFTFVGFVLFMAVTVEHVEQMKLSFMRWVVY